MESVESLREKFMENKPAPLPKEAYEGEQLRRRRKSLAETHAIPKWGWTLIGLAVVVVATTAIFAALGREAIDASKPAFIRWASDSAIDQTKVSIHRKKLKPQSR